MHDGGVNRIPKGRRFDGRKSRMVITFMVRLRLTLRATVRKGDDGKQRITSEELVGFLTCSSANGFRDCSSFTRLTSKWHVVVHRRRLNFKRDSTSPLRLRIKNSSEAMPEFRGHKGPLKSSGRREHFHTPIQIHLLINHTSHYFSLFFSFLSYKALAASLSLGGRAERGREGRRGVVGYAQPWPILPPTSPFPLLSSPFSLRPSPSPSRSFPLPPRSSTPSPPPFRGPRTYPLNR